MTSQIEQIHYALENYYAAIEAGKVLSKEESSERLIKAIMELEEAGKGLDPALPEQLKHYMGAKSYRKAFALTSELMA